MKNFLLLGLSLFVSYQCTSQNWTPLFNGKDLNGWTQLNGTAKYWVEDGIIIGKSKNEKVNSFLATDKVYGDFILEMDVWVDPDVNSGIQFRSESNADYHDGRVHGYQFELDPSERSWTGGVYDEYRRGWIYPLTENEEGRSAFKNGRWNHIRIEAIGPEISTWLNGVQCSRLIDDWTAEGFIALQVHGIWDQSHSGKLMKWKNIRIVTEELGAYRKAPNTDLKEYNYLSNQLSDLEKRRGWRLLWNGESMDGWSSVKSKSNTNKNWSIKDGTLTVNKSTNPLDRVDLVSDEAFSDFEMSIDFKITEGANSGIKYFLLPDELAKGNAIGLEFQILDDYVHPDATKGVGGNRTIGSLYDLIPAENLSEKSNANKRFFKHTWNRARIKVQGSKVEHWLNNVKIVEYDRHSQAFRALIKKSKYKEYEYFGQLPSGRIVLQDHGDRVQFRSIKIREF